MLSRREQLLITMNPLMRSGGGGADWWDIAGQTIVVAYQPIGADDLSDSYINLANPGTNNASPGTAPTWNSTDGWVFNGSDQWLETSIAPGDGYSMFVRFTNMGDDECVCGVYDDNAAKRFYIWYVGGSPDSWQYAYGGDLISSSAGTAYANGVIGLTSAFGYRGGVEDGTISSAWSAITKTINIARQNRNSPGGYFSGEIQAFALYSTTLSSANAATLTTAMAALT